ncbi:MAG: serine/threonine-protein kinase, partial [Pseudomonadota bacterium]
MTSYSDTLQRGDTISCYQIEEVLGRGGFAVTYLAVDLNLDVHVAIKEYLPREIIQRDQQLNVSARRPEFVEDYNIGLSNFAREAKTLARFKHPNIVRVHQVIHKHNTAYMVMDYEHGRELADELAERETLPEDELRNILDPIFDGVEEIHSHGLAHRDIKPSNIYLRENGSPVLLDFGAARYTMSESTQQLTAVVTVGYTPIEQYNVSENEQGPWSDIYALAAVLYEAVTGEMPVDSVTRASSRVTNTTDPLSPVANKTRQEYSDYFLNAIDWGLNMEAEDRPQSIAQWRDAFNGVFKAVETYEQQPKRPARKSKLKTRAKEPVAAHNTQASTDTRAYQPQPAASVESAPMDYALDRSPETLSNPDLRVDVRDAPFDPNFDDNIDHVEIVPLNPDAAPPSSRPVQSARAPAPGTARTPASAATFSDATATLEPPPPARPASPFASNPARKAPAEDYPDDPAFNDTLNNLIDAEGRPMHTQELRKVLRRDIVRREPPPVRPPQVEPPRNPGLSNPRYDAPPPDARDTDYSDQRADATRRMAPPRAPLHDEYPDRAPLDRAPLDRTPPERLAVRRAPIEDDFDFDETDWDYEPPAGPSRWKWILPVLGLAAVAGASLLYVNRPDLFQLPTTQSGPDMTVETALATAGEKIQNQELIFPEGQSALDYFQLILQSEPDNAEALGGIASIREEIKKQIVEHVDNDNLSQANRLLSRANAANLQIDSVGQNGVSTTAGSTDTTALAIDTTASPWVNERIETIESLMQAGDYTGAQSLFDSVDQFIGSAEVSASLSQRIAAGLDNAGATQSAPLAEDNTTIVTPIDNGAIQAESDAAQDTDAALVTTTEPPTANSIDNTSNDLAVNSGSNIGNNTDNTTVASVVAEPVPATEVPEVEQKIATATESDTLPSAPRRSFIEGNDDTAQHLNQLRLALEDKNIQRVLQVSDALPEERTEFLRRLFQRYDRLDVTIDNINRSGSAASAKLSVAMFNQRADGSFYSAGKWSDVELATRFT